MELNVWLEGDTAIESEQDGILIIVSLVQPPHSTSGKIESPVLALLRANHFLKVSQPRRGRAGIRNRYPIHRSVLYKFSVACGTVSPSLIIIPYSFGCDRPSYHTLLVFPSALCLMVLRYRPFSKHSLQLHTSCLCSCCFLRQEHPFSFYLHGELSFILQDPAPMLSL